VWARTYNGKFLKISVDAGPLSEYNGDMKDNYSTLDITLPLFIVGSFIIICFGSALGIIIQALTGTL
jgi:hypothetical protein